MVYGVARPTERSGFASISVGVGLVAAGAWWLSGLNLAPWKPGLIGFSLMFWPWFFVHTSRKNYVSTRAAWRARAEVGPGRRGGRA